MTSVTRILILFLLFVGVLCAQSNNGELRLKVTDPSGLGVKTTVQITSEANQYRNTLATTDQGSLDVHRLPYGIYQLEIKQPGFPAISGPVDIHSSIPTEYAIQLKLPSVNQSASVEIEDSGSIDTRERICFRKPFRRMGIDCCGNARHPISDYGRDIRGSEFVSYARR